MEEIESARVELLEYAEGINPEFERGVVWNRPMSVEFVALEKLLNSWKVGTEIDEELLLNFLNTIRDGDAPEDVVKWMLTTYCYELPMNLTCLFQVKRGKKEEQKVKKLNDLLELLRNRGVLKKPDSTIHDLQLSCREKFIVRSVLDVAVRGIYLEEAVFVEAMYGLGEEYLKRFFREGDSAEAIKDLILGVFSKIERWNSEGQGVVKELLVPHIPEIRVRIDEVVGELFRRNNVFFEYRNRE